MKKNPGFPILLLAVLVMAASCSEDPLAPFEPEVVTSADAFQFQVTGATNVSVTRSYTWTNTMTQATIDHSTALTDGAASVVILDGDGTQVYSSNLVASGTGTSAEGAAGGWTVKVTFTNFDGTANFRVERL